MSYIYSISPNTNKVYTAEKTNVFQQFELLQPVETKYAAYNPEINRNKKKSIIIKTSIVSAIIACALSLASKRVRVNLVKVLETLKASNENLINSSKEILSNPDVPLLTRIKIKGLRAVNRVTSSLMNFAGNIDHGKNHLTGQVTDNVPVVSKIVRFLNAKIKPIFTGTLKRASIDKYKATEQAAVKLQETLRQISVGSPELQSVLGSSTDDILKTLSNLSSKTKFDSRYKELESLIEKAVTEYKQRVSSIVKDTNIAKTAGQLLDDTISLKIAQQTLTARNADLLGMKHALSFAEKDKLTALQNLLKEMTVSSGYKPDTALVSKLQDAVAAFAKTSSEASKQEVLKVLSEASKSINHPEIVRSIAEVEKTITTANPGLLQNLIERLQQAQAKGLISGEAAAHSTKQIADIQNKLNKAVHFEMDNMAGRLLDLQIGPTPLLEATSIFIPAAVVAHDTLYDCENQQERNSKLLRFGPSIVGGIGSSIFALQKGLFGVKALGFGLLTGVALNRIGTFIDDRYYSKGKEFNTIKVLSSEKKVNPGVKIFEV